jgi:hypothetical protein
MNAKLAVTLVSVVTAASITAAANAPKPRDDVASTIMIMDGARDNSCAERKIVKTDVIEASQDKKPIVERWMLDRCGKTIPYLVKYSNGGKKFDVQLEK